MLPQRTAACAGSTLPLHASATGKQPPTQAEQSAPALHTGATGKRQWPAQAAPCTPAPHQRTHRCDWYLLAWPVMRSCSSTRMHSSLSISSSWLALPAGATRSMISSVSPHCLQALGKHVMQHQLLLAGIACGPGSCQAVSSVATRFCNKRLGWRQHEADEGCGQLGWSTLGGAAAACDAQAVP